MDNVSLAWLALKKEGYTNEQISVLPIEEFGRLGVNALIKQAIAESEATDYHETYNY